MLTFFHCFLTTFQDVHGPVEEARLQRLAAKLAAISTETVEKNESTADIEIDAEQPINPTNDDTAMELDGDNKEQSLSSKANKRLLMNGNKIKKMRKRAKTVKKLRNGKGKKGKTIIW